jgi:GH15 family glucan-1,4-alpha-glucosidase
MPGANNEAIPLALGCRREDGLPIRNARGITPCDAVPRANGRQTSSPYGGRRFPRTGTLDRCAASCGDWEERGTPCHHTHSKMMSAIGLHCAADLARRAGIDHGLAEPLRHAAAQAAAFVEASCVAPGSDAYARAARSDEYDASVLMPLAMGYERWSAPGRVDSTIDAIRERLGDGGNLLYRYRHDDGLPGGEGVFTPCSFWLASALARAGRVDEAAVVLDELTALANDVGLYSEELGSDGAFLGNLPQAITHASLISAAAEISNACAAHAKRSAGAPRGHKNR